jgi:hypothetical protein
MRAEADGCFVRPNYYYAAPIGRRSAAIIAGIRAKVCVTKRAVSPAAYRLNTSSIHEAVNHASVSISLGSTSPRAALATGADDVRAAIIGQRLLSESAP